jgi:P-type Ca2+ transporter type 2C
MLEKGLTDEEVINLRKQYGTNEIMANKKDNFFIKILHIISEPMFLLLIIAATIYFILGEPKDGIIMLIFVVGIITIDIIEEWKTDKTLNALKDLSAPKITVLRNGNKVEISSSMLVPGDIMYIHEGVKIPADGFIISCSGLRVDESSLTGESEGVWKTTKKYNGHDYWRDDYCYQGTLVIQGSAIIKVAKIGINTEYGKIGNNLNKIVATKTPLQEQTDKLVAVCAIIALFLFLLVGIITFINLPDHVFTDRLIESVLAGVTLAMAMIPEEFPVVLTVFLSMGAWRLAKKNSLVKKMPAVETLGAVSVLCVDKTGTITKNQMEVVDVITKYNKKDFAKIMGLCCDEETYDPMEKAMFKYAHNEGLSKDDIFKGKNIMEYPFSNETKIMGRVWQYRKVITLAAKGSPESILKICALDELDRHQINDEIKVMQKRGLRVIAIATNTYKKANALKNKLADNKLNFVGIVGLIDPPRDNITSAIATCKRAGIKVVMITGDNGITASAIAKKIGMDNVDNIITGEMIDKLNDKQLQEAVKDVSIFSRVIPEHKMRIVKALQANGEIVAMTGDGVNDAPALKQAEIGIAMGKRGSEVSREAADLILMDDNFTTIVDTIEDGRRIYDNIKKAIGYIFIIHLPICLSSLMAPLIGIDPSSLMLLPLHIVILELIIDPTCSIVLERGPAESNIMNRPPRNVKESIVTNKLLFKSIIQGLIIFLASFGTYYTLLNISSELARTMGILIIIFANIFLVQVNASDYDLTIYSLNKLLKDKLLLFINGLMLLGIFIITYTPLNNILKLQALSLKEFCIVILISFLSVFWYELVKIFKKM